MNKRIIRVFPRKTSYTPDDEMAFIGMPPIIIPEHDEIHVSCSFTWDKAYCDSGVPLKILYKAYTSRKI